MPINNKKLGVYSRPVIYYTGEELYTTYNKVIIKSEVDLENRFLGVKSYLSDRLLSYIFRYHSDSSRNNFISDMTYNLNVYDKGLVFQIVCDELMNKNNENDKLNASFIFAIPEDNDKIVKFDITIFFRVVFKKDLPKLIRKQKLEKLDTFK